MTMELTMTITIPIAEAKKRLSAIIKDVDEKFDRYAITKNGINKAVLMSSDEFDGLLETIDILSRREEREAIARAKMEVQSGQTVSLKDIKSKYGIK
jgi:antitoxin YefM